MNIKYAKINPNSNTVLLFPYDWDTLQSENPHTNYDGRFDLPGWYSQTNDAINTGSILVEVNITTLDGISTNTYNVIATTTPTLQNGVWEFSGWTVTEKTPEEIALHQKYLTDGSTA